MNMKKIFFALTMSLFAIVSFAAAKQQTLLSPDGTVAVTVTTGDGIRYSVAVDGKQVLAPSTISMTLENGTVYGGGATVRKTLKSSVNRTVKAQAYRKDLVKDSFNQLELFFKDFKLTTRNDNGKYIIVWAILNFKIINKKKSAIFGLFTKFVVEK